MFLFVCTALLAAFILGVKLTKDIFPKPLKTWLLTKAISNWMKGQPQKFGRAIITSIQSFEDTGVIADDQEVLVERPVPLPYPLLREEYAIYGTDEENRGLFVKITRLPSCKSQAEVLLTLKKRVYHASFEGQTSSAHEFSLGNLKMEMVGPFRVWRLWYNGVMTQSSSKSAEKKLVHVTFNFLWKALHNPMDNRKNGNANLLANHFSSNSLFGEGLTSLTKMLPEGYSQMGTLHGIVSTTDPNDTAASLNDEIYLYGFRRREIISSLEESKMFDIFPTVQRANDYSRRLEFFGICESGEGFRLTASNEVWTDGTTLWPSYRVSAIRKVDFSPSEILRSSTSRKLINISDHYSTLTVEILPNVKDTQFVQDGTRIKCLSFYINGKSAHGVLIEFVDETRNDDEITSYIEESSPDEYYENLQLNGQVSGETSHALEFSERACLKVPLVGGKGASLARLQMFTDKLSNDDIKTARGFCVTTNLFRETLKLEKFAKIFNSSSTTSTEANLGLENACLTVMKMILSSEKKERIRNLINPWVERVFGKDRTKIKFAVRSSGVLEDGADLSCAGQNETFLGVLEDAIPQRVLECWASLFTAQSVRYRLNHGQPAVSEMAVVIQEMVDASTAGVIFTADPLTGNPFEMVITANYGLGESVVSGSCDPDTITLTKHCSSGVMQDKNEKNKTTIIASSLKRKWWSDITIAKKVLGEKKTKIVCQSNPSMDKDGKHETTKEISMDELESKQFCLDEESALKLGIASGEIETFMGHKPVDIEWAIDQTGQIFILQCRNLTALDAWTDFEILHELDSAVRTKLDLFTTANSGEVLPKAMHPISQTMNCVLDVVCQQQIYLRKGDLCPISPYRTNSCQLFQQRLFMNMYQLFYSTIDKEIAPATVCADQSIFGRQVINEDIRKTAQDRFGLAPALGKITELFSILKMFWTFKSMVEKEEEKYKKFKLDYSNVPKKAADVYNKISQDLIHLYKAGETHMLVSSTSSVSQIFLFLFLAEGKKPNEWDSKLYEDASRLLSMLSNVESAEIPNDMNQLADAIIKNGGDEKHIMEEFLQASPPTKAIEWLGQNENMNKALGIFFEKHGHRGFAEMDLGEPSWCNNPLSLLPILQSTVKNRLNLKGIRSNELEKTIFKNDDELLDSLSSNLQPMTRRLIKLILPTCRNAVICREKTKSMFVRVCHQFKEKYHYLAQLMVQENLLPSENLITHLTHFEIGQLVKKDLLSGVILQKAMKRHKMYPKIEKAEFPEICLGIPKEMDTSIPVTVTDTIQATPVSRGVAKGIAKVCLSVEEASEILQPGDILVTHGTDIAWSPFFPILGGVVTELGGLISHGAVVAREYGLPCIVGAGNATKIFKTGDHVILDAGKGTLSKIFE